MKFLLVLLVVLMGVWLWRAKRQSDPKKPRRPPQEATPEPLDMVRCTLCSVHIPAADAVQGKKGPYCSADHLQRAEP